MVETAKEEQIAQQVKAATALISAAKTVAVLTGAGISTDSGIPDFRGPAGVWTLNPKAERASNIDVYLTEPEVRRANWRVMASGLWNSVEPNVGHHALTDLDKRGCLHTLVTQNVDGLHLLSGTASERVVEIHGTVWRSMCLRCGVQDDIEGVLERVRAGDEDPHCTLGSCGGLLKRATVSFGQALFDGDLDRALAAAGEADLLLVVGTTLAVGPVNLMVPTAVEAARVVVIVNGSPTDMDDLADVALRGSIGSILPKILRCADQQDSSWSNPD
ncbi:MAG: Sir2 family NAD-dependent protein deacetylase [Acidimicrobiales bacterium]|nr:Sir2 family NAD-dependent protein deacetylase [Acidimicrobiales bacterium]